MLIIDPASIFSIIAGSAGLALQCGKLVRDLHDVTDMYKNANLTVASLSTGLETIQWAWGRIEAILETWTEGQPRVTQPSLDTDTFQQLNRSLEAGRMVIAALEEDLMPLIRDFTQGHGSATSREILNRVQVIWNATALRDHQERIRDQMNSMTLMISLLKLWVSLNLTWKSASFLSSLYSVYHRPGALTPRQSLNANVDVLRKSDESAHTIVPSRLSVSTPSIWSHTDDSVVSEASESSLIYRELAFEDDLFTARVYKRNYRSQEVRKAKHEINNEDSTNETPKPLAVLTTVSNTPRMAVPRRSSATGVSEFPVISGPLIQPQSHLTTDSHWVVTGWIVPKDIDYFSLTPSKAYIGVPGPTVPKVFFEEQCLSAWGTNEAALLHPLDEYVIKNTDWKRIFEISISIPRQWLHHCFMAACIGGSARLRQLVVDEDRPQCLKSFNGCFCSYRYPIEVAVQQGHIPIVRKIIF